MKPLDFNEVFKKYLIGFVSAVVLSLVAFGVATSNLGISDGLIMAILLACAAVQLTVQLVCFLHLGVKGRSVDRVTTLVFTLCMMLVIVIGSLWIMKNLDYRMGMSSEAMRDYMLRQNKKGF